MPVDFKQPSWEAARYPGRHVAPVGVQAGARELALLTVSGVQAAPSSERPAVTQSLLRMASLVLKTFHEHGAVSPASLL